MRFCWIDIEDRADLVDPVDVENFPTVLISHLGVPLFFGTITPHAETLRRLVQNTLVGSGVGTFGPDVVALAQRLQALQAEPLP